MRGVHNLPPAARLAAADADSRIWQCQEPFRGNSSAALAAHMVLARGDATKRMVYLRKFIAFLFVQAIENRIVFAFNERFLAVLVNGLSIAADM